MLRILALLLVCSLSVLTGGCSGEKKPEADPNFKTSTNPSDIIVPPQMKNQNRAQRSRKGSRDLRSLGRKGSGQNSFGRC